MIPLLGGAFTAGLLGSPHCVGMCGAFATASADRTARPTTTLPVRLVAYMALVTTRKLGRFTGARLVVLKSSDMSAP